MLSSARARSYTNKTQKTSSTKLFDLPPPTVVQPSYITSASGQMEVDTPFYQPKERTIRQRMDQSLLKTRLFRLFKTHGYLTFAEINKEVQQPEQYLREILSQIADPETSGVMKNYYRLKPEFRT